MEEPFFAEVLAAVCVVMNEKGIDIPLIIMTGYADIQSAVQAMKLGARDYSISEDRFRRDPVSVNRTGLSLPLVLQCASGHGQCFS